MNWYQWFSLTALVICLGSLILHAVRLIRLGNPKDFSQPIGKTGSAMPYAFVGAMSPAKKESAFLHMPTYVAGIIYHLGTFLSIFLFFLILAQINFTEWVNWAIAGFLLISGLCGIGILIKRIVKKQMRELSNPDDYISNALVSAFHLITAFAILSPVPHPSYFVFTGLLLLYIPIGKLKHTIYFFAARYQLGCFFGWRGVWPPKHP
nr:hypothetical protein [Bacteroidota bacterium]